MSKNKIYKRGERRTLIYAKFSEIKEGIEKKETMKSIYDRLGFKEIISYQNFVSNVKSFLNEGNNTVKKVTQTNVINEKQKLSHDNSSDPNRMKEVW